MNTMMKKKEVNKIEVGATESVLHSNVSIIPKEKIKGEKLTFDDDVWFYNRIYITIWKNKNIKNIRKIKLSLFIQSHFKISSIFEENKVKLSQLALTLNNLANYVK